MNRIAKMQLFRKSSAVIKTLMDSNINILKIRQLQIGWLKLFVQQISKHVDMEKRVNAMKVGLTWHLQGSLSYKTSFPNSQGNSKLESQQVESLLLRLPNKSPNVYGYQACVTTALQRHRHRHPLSLQQGFPACAPPSQSKLPS